jgi:RNA polymerase sigma factor (sigma-70 family)
MPHLDAAYNLAHWLTRDRRAAEDLVQDACVRALKFIDGFRGGNSRAWLLTIVRNSYYSGLKKRRPEGIQLPFDEARIDADGGVSYAGPLPERDDVTTMLEREETRALIQQALNELPDEYREVVILRELEDLSYQEIARIVQVPLGTVMSRLSRARKLLCRGLQHLRPEL